MALTPDQIDHFAAEGYVIVRGLFDSAEIEELRAGFDHVQALAASESQLPAALMSTDERPSVHGPNARRVYFHVQRSNGLPRVRGDAARYLRKVQWPACLHPAFETIRTSSKFSELLRPHLGDTIKQYINQINFKMPGGGIQFPFHQDVRDGAVDKPLQNYVQTCAQCTLHFKISTSPLLTNSVLLSASSPTSYCRYTLVDKATEDNGCLWVLPRSHLHGVLKGEDLTAVLNQGTAVPVTGRPGDCLLFTCVTCHLAGLQHP